MTSTRTRALGRMGRLGGALLAAAGLLAGAASYGAPVEAGDCKRLTVESVTGPPQLDGNATADFKVTVHNPADRNPGADPCNDGMQLEIATSGSLRPGGATDADGGIVCTEEPPSSVVDKGQYRCVAAAFDGGDRATVTVSVRAAEAGPAQVTAAAWRLEEERSASRAGGFGLKSLNVTVRPGTSAPLPTVRRGATGEAATTVQYLLRHHGAGLEVDDDFGTQTEGAVRDFQRKKNLTVDGVVGPQTWQALFVTVRQGDSSDAVSALQGQFASRGVDVEIDGDFGSQTAEAVRDFQQEKGLAADGVVGPQTWAALLAAD